MHESPGISGNAGARIEGLRCETCGYDIAGIVLGGRCPECGLAVAESMPERRIGTAWQRGKGFRGYADALWDGIFGGSRSLRRARPSISRDTSLYMLNCLVSAAMPVGAYFLATATLREVDVGDMELLGVALAICLGVGVGTLTISFFALLVFYCVWMIAAITVRRFDADEGAIAASGASSWLVLGSGVCSVSLVSSLLIGPIAGVFFLVGLFGGWGGYAFACYRGLRALRFANMPKAVPFADVPPTIPSNEPTPSNPSHLHR